MTRQTSAATKITDPIPSEAERHAWALDLSSRLTRNHREMFEPGASMVTAREVIRVLNEAEVSFVLMGTYGITSWRKRPRATQDVDVLVSKKDHRKATRAISTAYPDLQIKDTPVVTRFIDPASNEPVIDLMKPAQEVFKMVFRHTVWVGSSHRIPNLEMALISKFAAMTSPHRNAVRKMTDGGDFGEIVLRNHQNIDRAKLFRLGNRV